MIKNLYFSLCMALSSCVCAADEIERMPVPEAGFLTDQEIAYAQQIADAMIEPKLYGGREIEPGEIPMVVNVGFCSYNIVGKNSILYAGHCGQTGSTASFMYKGVKHIASCTRHPQFNNNTLHNDFGMCRFSPSIEDKIWGTISNKAPSVSDVVVLSGYGRGSPGGRLNVAKLPIARLNGSQEIFTQSSKTYLGGGDSSGALFADFPDLKDTSKALIIAVNSRAGGGTSIFNRVDHPEAQAFFKDWATKTGNEVCGINKDCYEDEPIDPPKPPDPPKPEPPQHCAEEKSFVKMAESKLKLFQDMLASCR